MKIEKIGLCAVGIFIIGALHAQEKGENKAGNGSANDEERIQKDFVAMDADKSGELSMTEFLTKEKDKEKGKKKFEKIDSNKDKKISKDEYYKFVYTASKDEAKGKNLSVQERFDLMDIKKDGALTTEDLKAKGEMEEDEATATIASMDEDKDGKVTLQEYMLFDRVNKAPEKRSKPTLQDKFNEIDLDQSKSFDFEEIERNGMSDQISKQKYMLLDMDQSGSVDFQEFDAFHKRKEGMDSRAMNFPDEFFAQKDADKDGFLIRDEAKAFGEDDNDAEVSFGIKDKDKDEKISLKEYKEWAKIEVENTKKAKEEEAKEAEKAKKIEEAKSPISR